MLKHYIEFYHPGIIVSERSEEEVKKRERPAKIPNNVFGYRFFSREVVTKNGETLQGEAKDFSPCTYIGKTRTLSQVKNETPHEKILIDNMEIMDTRRLYTRALVSRFLWKRATR